MVSVRGGVGEGVVACHGPASVDCGAPRRADGEALGREELVGDAEAVAKVEGEVVVEEELELGDREGEEQGEGAVGGGDEEAGTVDWVEEGEGVVADGGGECGEEDGLEMEAGGAVEEG